MHDPSRATQERQTRPSRWAKAFAGLAITSLLLAACGGAETSTAPSAAASAAATTGASAAPTSEASQATGGDVPRNQTLIFGAVTATLRPENNWNPLFAQATHPDSNAYGLWEELFYTNLNTGELIPWQAESYTLSADYTGVTLKLRDGVTWCDGVPFTAEDVKFTLDILKTGEPEYFDAANYKEYIKDVTVVDPLTVEITLTKPAPKWFKEEFTLGRDPYAIAPKHLFEGEDTKTFTFYDLAKGFPCTTGPFKIVSSSPEKLVLEPRDTWWGAETGFAEMPAVKREIFFPIKDEQACANLYLTNEVDLCGDLQPGLLTATIAQNPKVRSWNKEGPVWGAPDGCLYNFAFNTTTAPFDDVNVRLAINYAFDRQQITDLAYEGAMPPAVLPWSSYFAPQWQPGRVQEVVDKYDRGTHSQAKVDEYMATAGFAKNAAGFWEKDGKQLDIYFSYLDFMAPIGPVLQQQLTVAGFNTTSKIDPKWDVSVFPGDQANWVLVHCNSFGEPYAAYNAYNPKWAVDNGTPCTLWYGCSRWKNEEFGELLTKMEAVPADPAQDSEYMDWTVRLTELYLENMPEIILTEELHPITYNEYYWTGYATAEDPYVAPYYCCWDASYMYLFNLEPTGAE